MRRLADEAGEEVGDRERCILFFANGTRDEVAGALLRCPGGIVGCATRVVSPPSRPPSEMRREEFVRRLLRGDVGCTRGVLRGLLRFGIESL